MRFWKSIALAVLLAALLAPAGAVAEVYSESQVRALARDLAMRQQIPPEKLGDLMTNLEAALHDPWFSYTIRNYPVAGVLVFRAGEGGFIVKLMKGTGLVSFKGDRQAAPIFVKNWSAGAQVGGAAIWAVGLVMGLRHSSHFGGDYVGEVSSATAADVTTRNGAVFNLSAPDPARRAHYLYLVFTARGLSAGVAGARMTITPSW